MRRKIFTKFITSLFLLTAFFAFSVEIHAQSKKAKKLVSEADKLLQQKNYQAAIDKYAEAIVAEPNYANAHYSKGVAHYSLNQYDESAEELTAALAQGYKPLDVYKLRWNIYYQKKDYDNALKDLQELMKLEPANAAYGRSLGDIYLGKKDWQAALDAYKKSSQANPNDADLLYLMAVAYYNLGETSEQEIAASDAIRKNTKYMGEAYFLTADALQKSKSYDESVLAYQKSIAAKPDIYEAYVNLSDVYRSLNRFNDSIDTANKGLAQFPNDANLYTSLSWYYSLADRSQEAVGAALSATKYAPNVSMGYTNLCRAYNDTKQYQLAIQSCNTALKISPNDGETNFYLGRANDFLNKPEIATKFYEKAVVGLLAFTRDNPEYSDGFYLLGNAYFSIRQRDKAIEAYKQSLILSPRFAKAKFNLGYMYFLNNDLPKARQQYEELKKIDPASAEKLKQAMDKK
jgi:tetratricopeptide (TPR) repeat protein